MKNKTKILDTAMNLIIEDGFSGTSMNHIHEASGISIGGIYYYFKTKEDIINQIYQTIKKDIIEYTFQHINLEDSTRKFVEDYWYARVSWAMIHGQEKKFMEMYYQKPHHEIRVCDEIAVKYNKLIARVNKAVEAKEINTLDCLYFFADIDSSVNVILNYIENNPDVYVNETLSFAFKKYWRSIVNI